MGFLMKKILFICHGNICRSPMAEFVMKDLVKKAGRESEFYIESAACRTDEIGNDMYPPAQRKLREMGVPYSRRAARLLRFDDYEKWDLLVCMDDENLRDMHRLFGKDEDGKIHKLTEYFDETRDVADPWYTGNFDATFSDVLKGCKKILEM